MGVLILVGLGCVGQGFIAVMGNAQHDPQVLTCAQLAQAGPGNNGHVTVTQFRARIDSIVVKGGDGKTYWREAFIPLVPDSDPQQNDFHVLLDSMTLDSPEKLRSLGIKSSVTGLINQVAEGPDERARQLLAGAYPGVDMSHCWVVHHDVSTFTRFEGIGLLVAGAVAFGVVVLIAKRTPASPPPLPTAGPVSSQFQA